MSFMCLTKGELTVLQYLFAKQCTIQYTIHYKDPTCSYTYVHYIIFCLKPYTVLYYMYSAKLLVHFNEQKQNKKNLGSCNTHSKLKVTFGPCSGR